jgi:hypothetical protein
VGGVEVLDPEACGEFADFVVDAFRDFVWDLVEEVQDGVGGGAVFLKQGFAKEGGVELS